MINARRLLILVGAGALIAAGAHAASAHAAPLPQDPPPGPVCGGPGLPPCAPPGDPNVMCAIIVWRTWTPCNYWGVQVPQGTPGSWG